MKDKELRPGGHGGDGCTSGGRVAADRGVGTVSRDDSAVKDNARLNQLPVERSRSGSPN